LNLITQKNNQITELEIKLQEYD